MAAWAFTHYPTLKAMTLSCKPVSFVYSYYAEYNNDSNYEGHSINEFTK